MKILRGVLVAIVFLLCFFGVKFLVQFYRGSSLENRIAETEAELKRQLALPKRIDEITTLIDVKVYRGTTVYIHRVDTDAKMLDHGLLQERIKNNVCQNPLIKADIQRGVTYGYQYLNRTGDYIAYVAIATCG